MVPTTKHCPQCNTEASLDAFFCIQCGRQFALNLTQNSPYVCDQCETSLPGGSHFCPGCGQALDEPVPFVISYPNTAYQSQNQPPHFTTPTSVPINSQVTKIVPRVNFGWIGEAWKIVMSDSGTFTEAILAQLIMPMLMLFALIWISGLFVNRLHPDINVWKDPSRDNLIFFVTSVAICLSLIYFSRLNKACFVVINRKLRGETIKPGDTFRGDWNIWSNLFLNCIYAAIIFFCSLSSAAYVFPIFFIFPLFALLLPAPAMVADGINLLDAMQQSFKLMRGDWFRATWLVVVLYLIQLLGGLFFGLGLLLTIPLFMIVSGLAYRDMGGMPRMPIVDAPLTIDNESPAVADVLQVKTNITEQPKVSVPESVKSAIISQVEGKPLPVSGRKLSPKTTLILGGLFAGICLIIGISSFHKPHTIAPDVVPVNNVVPIPVRFVKHTHFPVQWGPYTITRQDVSSGDLYKEQKVSVLDSRGVELWKEDNTSIDSASECSITGLDRKELRIIAVSGGSGGFGTTYYFSRENGLRLLFSYNFGDDDDITGFAYFDHIPRPEMQVDHSIVNFDGLSHAERQDYSCVYKWDGSHYVNVTHEFPHDAHAAGSASQESYLKHWRENPTADFNGIDEDIEGGDSADRADAIGYWANAMASGDGDTAKNWLLAHANSRLATHLWDIESDLKNQIPAEGARLDIEMGDGKNLDKPTKRR